MSAETHFFHFILFFSFFFFHSVHPFDVRTAEARFAGAKEPRATFSLGLFITDCVYNNIIMPLSLSCECVCIKVATCVCIKVATCLCIYLRLLLLY